MSTFKYQIGDIVNNNIKIISLTKKNNKRSYEYYCECLLCNNNFISKNLCTLKKQKDCGCISKDIIKNNPSKEINQKFGKLLVLSEFMKGHSRYFICECDCGNKTEVYKNHLIKGKIKSCGCLSIESLKHRAWKGAGELSSTYWSSCISNAKQRKIQFDLDIEYGWKLFEQQNKKCALTGIPLQFYTGTQKSNKVNQTASLDRIDSSKGYIEGNVWWVHKQINQIKMDLSVKDLLFWANQLIDFNDNQNYIDHIRPSWPDYFIGIAHLLSCRSHDSETRHGCIITNQENIILGSGYNGFPKQLKDYFLKSTRPDKYDYMIHAELNAIMNSYCRPFNKATAWVTGESCNHCLMSLWQAGVTKVICHNKHGSQQINEKTRKIRDQFIEYSGIEFQLYDANLEWLFNKIDILRSDYQLNRIGRIIDEVSIK